MPLGKGVRYRVKKGKRVRLAFKRNKVVEAKVLHESPFKGA